MGAAVVDGPRAASREHQADDDEKGNESLFSGTPKIHRSVILADASGESQGDGEDQGMARTKATVTRPRWSRNGPDHR